MLLLIIILKLNVCTVRRSTFNYHDDLLKFHQ